MTDASPSWDQYEKVRGGVLQRKITALVTSRLATLIFLIIAVALIFRVFVPNFLTENSLVNLARQSTVTVIVALGATFVIVAGEIDLSVGSVVALVDVLTAWTSQQGFAVPIMLLSALAAGLVFGILNGFLVLKLGVPSFLATLGTLSVAQGLALTVALDPIPVLNLSFISFFESSFAGIPMPVIIALALFVVTVLLLNRSRFGLWTRAVGCNESGARLAGLNARRQKYLVLILGAFFAAIGGVVLAGRTDYGMAESGAGLELIVIAAVILGGARLGGGVGSIVGSALGAIFVTMVFTGIATVGLPGPYQDIAEGVAIGAAILLMRR